MTKLCGAKFLIGWRADDANAIAMAMNCAGNRDESIGAAARATDGGVSNCLAVAAQVSIGKVDESRVVHGYPQSSDFAQVRCASLVPRWLRENRGTGPKGSSGLGGCSPDVRQGVSKTGDNVLVNEGIQGQALLALKIGQGRERVLASDAIDSSGMEAKIG